MKSTLRIAAALSALLAVAAPARAQQPPAETPNATAPADAKAAPATDPAKEKEATPPESILKEREIAMQHFRPLDRRGINMFEPPKDDKVEYKGFKLDWNAAFTSQVQNLDHSNTAAANVVGGVNTNQLMNIGFGFNNSTANLYLNAQLAKGIRVQLTSYLSARHHNETWVKDGFILIDESPIDIKPLNKLMEYTTLRVGHFEINYGDAHFRRTDNGHAVFNPFVGNLIMDAFTTEIGAEVYLRNKSGLMAMGALTAGELRGTVLSPEQRSPTFLGKAGFDRQVKPNLRVRLTGSLYRNSKALSNTLYGGDRAGSRYYYVLENTAAAEASQFTSGNINPGFKNEITACMINPFVKLGNLEVFGVIERASGKASSEAERRTFNQQSGDVVYRLLGDALYVGGRYNRVEGRLAGMTDDVSAKRWQVGGGWFVTSGLLVKAEYVNQQFSGYPVTNIRNGGKFKGMMFEGVVAF
jgi:hypothetical protein